MRDSYILGFRATVRFSPKNTKELLLMSVTKRQTLYFVVEFEKLNKLKNIQSYLRSWSPGEALSSSALTLIPKTNTHEKRKKNR